MLSLYNLKKYIIIGISILCSLYIYIEPTIKLNGKKEINLPYGTTYKEEGYYLYYPLKEIKVKIKVHDNINYDKLGAYRISYEFNYEKKEYKTERIVKIIDNEKPNITLKGLEDTMVCPNHTYEEEGYEATDNYDGNITDKVIIDKKQKKNIYKVTDSSDNKIEKIRNFVYKDEEQPTIKLKGNDTIYIYLNSTYEEPGYEAIDNCDGDLTSKVEIENNIDSFNLGNYIIKYKVTDSSNLSTEITRNVIVKKLPDNNGKVIYLTFDDGPSSTITPQILQILREEGVKATFFVINHSDALNYLIKQEHDDGHTVALHSYSHNYRYIYTSSDNYFGDLNLISDKVYSITGVRSDIIRFPGGSSNAVSKFNPGIMTQLAKQVMNKGYIYFDWNVGSGDAGEVRSSNEVYNNVTSRLGGYTNVVLMHDYEGNYYTLNALRAIIRYGKEHGYTFANITSSTPQVKHRIAN